MIEFMSGAVTICYLLSAVFFFRFWRKTSDRLFFAFALAFCLFALNQTLAFFLRIYSEPYSFIYVLRIIGLLAILVAIVDKNVSTTTRASRATAGSGGFDRSSESER